MAEQKGAERAYASSISDSERHAGTGTATALYDRAGLSAAGAGRYLRDAADGNRDVRRAALDQRRGHVRDRCCRRP